MKKTKAQHYYACACATEDIFVRFNDKACTNCGPKVVTMPHYWRFGTIAIYRNEVTYDSRVSNVRRDTVSELRDETLQPRQTIHPTGRGGAPF